MRDEKNFKFSDFCMLDFETHEYTLSQAVNDFCDYRHIIGTTRNHQRAKKSEGPCDRFRVVIPWKTRIENLRDFKYTMAKLAAKYDSDSNATDGARMFFPCKEIISIQDGESFDTMAWQEAPSDFGKVALTAEQCIENLFTTMVNYQRTKRLPRHIEDFLFRGVVFGPEKSRACCCFIVALHLFECGWNSAEIARALRASPFDREGFADMEFDHAVDGAYRNLKRMLTNGSGKNKRERGGFEGVCEGPIQIPW